MVIAVMIKMSMLMMFLVMLMIVTTMLLTVMLMFMTRRGGGRIYTDVNDEYDNFALDDDDDIALEIALDDDD